MKKLFFITILAPFTISTTYSQIIQKPVPVVKKDVIIKTNPRQQPPPPPTAVPEYYLTSVRVNIFTGNDNKEYLSKVGIDLFCSGGASTDFGNTNPELLLFGYPAGDKSIPEMKINSNTEFVLQTGNPGNLYLIQQYGLKLKINYWANFILDAWKIDKVTMTLEFKDKKGNPHPTLATKTVTFLNASMLMTDSKFQLVCETDGFLFPKF